MTLSYYRCDWRHPENDDPVVILYEADAQGRVPRMIEIFSDGRRNCLSTEDFVGRENEMPGIESLVEGSFFDAGRELLDGLHTKDETDEVSVAKIDAESFEQEWSTHRVAKP